MCLYYLHTKAVGSISNTCPSLRGVVVILILTLYIICLKADLSGSSILLNWKH